MRWQNFYLETQKQEQDMELNDIKANTNIRQGLFDLRLKDFDAWFDIPAKNFSDEELLDLYTFALDNCVTDFDMFGCSIIKKEILKRMH